MPHPVLYEINTRCWLNELSRKAGSRITLAKVEDRFFEEWKRLGFTHIWLMGVWTPGKQSREHALNSQALRRDYDKALPGWTPDDVGGSPYAIATYRVPRALGGDAGLKLFREKLHSYGMKLILDFVPNHLAMDHPWTIEHPERFVQCDTVDASSFIGGSKDFPVRLCHGRDPYFAAWKDTSQLDYRRADTRAAVTQDLLSVAGRCDGLRCDMAMLLIEGIFAETWKEHPCRDQLTQGEFWPVAIQAVRKQSPGFLFLAEVYWDRENQLIKQGFDYAYHKPFTDAAISHQETIQAVVMKSVDWIEAAAHFLENHDELRVASTLSLDVHRAAVWAQMSLPGMRFLHEGQLQGWKIRTPVQLSNRVEEATETAINAMYEKVFSLLATTSIGQGLGKVVIARQAWADNPTHGSFLLAQWHIEDEMIFYLVVVNFAPHRSQCYADLDVESLASREWDLEDLLSDDRYLRNGADMESRGLYLDVPAYATQCFKFTSKP